MLSFFRLLLLVYIIGAAAGPPPESPLSVVVAHGHAESNGGIHECRSSPCIFMPEDKLYFYKEGMQVFPQAVLHASNNPQLQDVFLHVRESDKEPNVMKRFSEKMHAEERRRRRRFAFMEMEFPLYGMTPGNYYMMFPGFAGNEDAEGTVAFPIHCYLHKRVFRKPRVLCEFHATPERIH
jgi:hypothetical protein